MLVVAAVRRATASMRSKKASVQSSKPRMARSLLAVMHSQKPLLKNVMDGLSGGCGQADIVGSRETSGNLTLGFSFHEVYGPRFRVPEQRRSEFGKFKVVPRSANPFDVLSLDKDFRTRPKLVRTLLWNMVRVDANRFPLAVA